LLRIPAVSGDSSRIELRSPDPSCNPYLAFAFILQAGMEGIQHARGLEEACNLDFNEEGAAGLREGLRGLPVDLAQALEQAKQSEFVTEFLPCQVWDKYYSIKKAECQQYERAADKEKVEAQMYFMCI